MKKLIIAILSLVVFSCGAKKQISTNPDSSPEQTVLIKKSVDFSEVKASLAYLASDELQGRATGSTGIEKAAIYIENIFTSNGIKPYFKTYRDSFNINNMIGYNVVGYLEGNDPELKKEFVILGAHYDHIGRAKIVNGDSIANGANDDASGTVAVLEWAKYFAKSKSNKRSLLFTLYDAEEIGLKGSEHLAKRLKTEELNLYTMINFEMIGVPRATGLVTSYLTGYNKSNMAEKLNTYAGTKLIGFFPKAKMYRLFMRSDNYPFFKAFGIPAHAISTFDFTNFEYYHHVDDETENMDIVHMTSFINKMIPALEGMINASTNEIKMNNE